MLKDDVERDWMYSSMSDLMKCQCGTWAGVLKIFSSKRCDFRRLVIFTQSMAEISLAVEIDVSKVWLNSSEHLYSFGRLLK